MTGRSQFVFAAILALTAQMTFAAQHKASVHGHKRTGRLSAEMAYYADACGDHYMVPRELMRAIMLQESGGNPYAIATKNSSPALNGRGAMQLIPATAARYGVMNTFSPSENTCGAAHYLADLMQEFGDLREVVAAYYCGEHRIERKGLRYSNPDVIAYVESVHRLYTEEFRKEGLYEEIAAR